MAKQITIIQGHPDPQGNHFGHALAAAYTKGAQEAGHAVRCVEVATLDFPLVRTKEDWGEGSPPAVIRAAQEAIAWANHLVIVYPLWLGTMPALLKAFFEQTLRPGFAISATGGKEGFRGLLAGRSARVVVTMGMPALLYRWYFGAHSLKSLERNILHFCGIKPIKESVIGMVEGSASAREKWLAEMKTLGTAGQ